MSDEEGPKEKKPQKQDEDGVSQELTAPFAKEKLIKEINKLQECLSTLLVDAKKTFAASLEEFVSDKVRRLSSAIGHYYNAFCALGVLGRHEMDRQIGKHYSDEDLVESIDKLMDLEHEWNSFLEEVDRKMMGGGERREELAIGSPGPCDLMLTDVRSNRDYLIKDILESVGHTSLVLILLRHFA